MELCWHRPGSRLPAVVGASAPLSAGKGAGSAELNFFGARGDLLADLGPTLVPPAPFPGPFSLANALNPKKGIRLLPPTLARNSPALNRRTATIAIRRLGAYHCAAIGRYIDVCGSPLCGRTGLGRALDCPKTGPLQISGTAAADDVFVSRVNNRRTAPTGKATRQHQE